MKGLFSKQLPVNVQFLSVDVVTLEQQQNQSVRQMCSESLLCFLQGRMFKNTNILTKHYTTHSALSVVVVLYSPSFYLNTCAAESTYVLEITKLCCLSPVCLFVFCWVFGFFSVGTIIVRAFWLYLMQGWCRS